MLRQPGWFHLHRRQALRWLSVFALCLGLTWVTGRWGLAQPAPHTSPDCLDPTPRVAVAGDSWAMFMWQDGVHNQAFDAYGHADKLAVSNTDLRTGYAIGGSMVRQWAKPHLYPYLDNLIAELEANPTLDTVYFALGGNDFLIPSMYNGGWYKDMPPEEEEAALQEVLDDALIILDALRAVRPNLRIVMTGYDFPNLFESGLSGTGLWVKLRQPTTLELNEALVRMERQRAEYVAQQTNVYLLPAAGLTHHAFGYHGDQGAPFEAGEKPLPGQTPPDYWPLPGGDINYPGSMEGMRDAIHLNPAGYTALLSHQTASYFLPIFRGQPAHTLYAAGGLYDGWVRQDGNVGDQGIIMGDWDWGVAYRGFLTFDTSSISDDEEITSAALYIRRQSLVGRNPFDTVGDPWGKPRLDVKTGTFGAPEVEADDFAAPADVVDGGCLYGSLRQDGYWARLELTADALAALNRDGFTQFRLYFPNANGEWDYMLFEDGDSPTARPYLDIETRRPTDLFLPTLATP